MNSSILGCGWLGLPLAKQLITEGDHVNGSTTHEDKIDSLKEHGITPYLIRLTPTLEQPDEALPFWESDLLVLNIPPGRSRDNVQLFHPKQVRAVRSAAEKGSIKRVIYVSSTSVYPPLPGKVTEQDAVPGEAVRDSGNALLEGEQILQESTAFSTTVLRFGGLMGPDRHPAKYMAGKTDLPKAHAPVNLIHQDDCIAIISRIIRENINGEVLNGVADGHPTRKAYYTAAAKERGMEEPTFREPDDSDDKDYKEVSNEKLKRVLQYTFTHPIAVDR